MRGPDGRMPPTLERAVAWQRPEATLAGLDLALFVGPAALASVLADEPELF